MQLFFVWIILVTNQANTFSWAGSKTGDSLALKIWDPPTSTSEHLFYQGIHQSLRVWKIRKAKTNDAIDGHGIKGRTIFLSSLAMQHDEKNTSQHVEIKHVSRGVRRSFILRSFLRVAFLVSKGKAPMFTPAKRLFQKYQWLTSALYLKSMALMIWNNYFNHFRFKLTIAHIGEIKTWYWEYVRLPYSTTTIISASMIPKS